MIYALSEKLVKLSLNSYSLEEQFYILLLRLKLFDLITRQKNPKEARREFFNFIKGSSRKIYFIENDNPVGILFRSVLKPQTYPDDDIVLSYQSPKNKYIEHSDLNDLIVRMNNYFTCSTDFIKSQQIANTNKVYLGHPDFSKEGRLAAIIYYLLEYGFTWPNNLLKKIDAEQTLKDAKISLEKIRNWIFNPSQLIFKEQLFKVDLGKEIALNNMLTAIFNPTFTEKEMLGILLDSHRISNIFLLSRKLDPRILIKKLRELFNSPKKINLENLKEKDTSLLATMHLVEKAQNILLEFGFRIIFPSENTSHSYFNFLSALQYLSGTLFAIIPDFSSFSLEEFKEELIKLIPESKIEILLELAESLKTEMHSQLKNYGVPQVLQTAMIRIILQNSQSSIHAIKVRLLEKLGRAYSEKPYGMSQNSALYHFYHGVLVPSGANLYLIPLVTNHHEKEFGARKFILKLTFILQVRPLHDLEMIIPGAEVNVDLTFTHISPQKLSVSCISNFYCHDNHMLNLVRKAFSQTMSNIQEYVHELDKQSLIPEPCIFSQTNDIFTPRKSMRAYQPSIFSHYNQSSNLATPTTNQKQNRNSLLKPAPYSVAIDRIKKPEDTPSLLPRQLIFSPEAKKTKSRQGLYKKSML